MELSGVCFSFGAINGEVGIIINILAIFILCFGFKHISNPVSTSARSLILISESLGVLNVVSKHLCALIPFIHIIFIIIQVVRKSPYNILLSS